MTIKRRLNQLEKTLPEPERPPFILLVAHDTNEYRTLDGRPIAQEDFSLAVRPGGYVIDITSARTIYHDAGEPADSDKSFIERMAKAYPV
ncbi:MAG: hypothetical protein HPY45_01840 [Anaerolineae bacterium]|nr:hypothetical protein [Anaerolineae bacterium]